MRRPSHTSSSITTVAAAGRGGAVRVSATFLLLAALVALAYRYHTQVEREVHDSVQLLQDPRKQLHAATISQQVPHVSGQDRFQPSGVLSETTTAAAGEDDQEQLEAYEQIAQVAIGRLSPLGASATERSVKPGDADVTPFRQVERTTGRPFHECRPEPHAGYGGDTFTWGINFKVKDEGECCAACEAHAKTCGQGKEGTVFWHASLQAGGTKCGKQEHVCNTWTYCPLDRCFSYDIHNHTQHECWLKYNENPRKPFVGSRGTYPLALRTAERKHWPHPVKESVWPWPMPEKVSWTSGIIGLDESKVVDHGDAFSMAPWYPHFCKNHGPCKEIRE